MSKDSDIWEGREGNLFFVADAIAVGRCDLVYNPHDNVGLIEERGHQEGQSETVEERVLEWAELLILISAARDCEPP